MAREAASMALRPASGWMPACAARPTKVASSFLSVGAAPTMEPISPVWSNTKPQAALSTDGSNRAAPRRPISSHGVSTSSMPAWGRRSASTRRTATSSVATADLSSPPRMVGWRLVRCPSSSTTSMGPRLGTVSRWAQNMTGVPGAVAGNRATMLPQPAGMRAPASSSLISAPSPRSSSRTTAATAPSCPDGDGISHSRAMTRATSGSASRVAASTP